MPSLAPTGQNAALDYETTRDPKAAVVRTTNVSHVQESLTATVLDEALERPTVVCKDCNSPSPIDSLIEVDALHVQCPRCLFVFFLNKSRF